MVVMKMRSRSQVLPAKQQKQQQQVVVEGAVVVAGPCLSMWYYLGNQAMCRHSLEPLAGPNQQQQQQQQLGRQLSQRQRQQAGMMVTREGPSKQRDQQRQWPSELGQSCPAVWASGCVVRILLLLWNMQGCIDRHVHFLIVFWRGCP
jgi:hypothetical protein